LLAATAHPARDGIREITSEIQTIFKVTEPIDLRTFPTHLCGRVRKRMFQSLRRGWKRMRPSGGI
jgi:hypothetical protein